MVPLTSREAALVYSGPVPGQSVQFWICNKSVTHLSSRYSHQHFVPSPGGFNVVFVGQQRGCCVHGQRLDVSFSAFELCSDVLHSSAQCSPPRGVRPGWPSWEAGCQNNTQYQQPRDWGQHCGAFPAPTGAHKEGKYFFKCLIRNSVWFLFFFFFQLGIPISYQYND